MAKCLWGAMLIVAGIGTSHADITATNPGPSTATDFHVELLRGTGIFQFPSLPWGNAVKGVNTLDWSGPGIAAGGTFTLQGFDLGPGGTNAILQFDSAFWTGTVNGQPNQELYPATLVDSDGHHATAEDISAGLWSLVPTAHPVPEPSTYLLAVIGLAGIAAWSAGTKLR